MDIDFISIRKLKERAIAYGKCLIDLGNAHNALPCRRTLGIELLECRRVLASVTVTNAQDVVNGDTSSITSLMGNNGGDGVSLREAIFATNNTSGSDTIAFDLGGVFATPQEILLTSGQFDITEDLTLDAPGAQLLTINAQLNSRIFSITALTGNYTFRGLTLTNGRTSGGEDGGAIRSATSGDVLIESSSITGNSTTGNFAHGGGIYTNGNLTIKDSSITSNSTTGTQSAGGGIYVLSDYLSLYDSTVSNNTTIGVESSGGAIAVPNSSVTLTRSTISGNSTAGADAVGGGISAYYTTLVGSTVSGNHTTGNSAHGGGIFGYQVTLYNSTVSGNSTSGDDSNGGGIATDDGGTVTLAQSTVTNNQTTNSNSSSGGLYVANGGVTLAGSIVSANAAVGGNPDVLASGSTLQANYSLIGTGVTPSSGGNNVVTDSPLLAALTNNGGSTETHALLGGSPAINASDPSAVLGVGIYAFVFDQRANDYGRLQGGRVDIGAFEVRDTPSADFEGDGLVTGLDFLSWQRGVGTTALNAIKIDGDADNDLDSDSSDLNVWELQYGGGPIAVSVSDPKDSSAAITAIDSPLDDTRVTSLPLSLSDRMRANDESDGRKIAQVVHLMQPSRTSSDAVTSATDSQIPALLDDSVRTFSSEESSRAISTWLEELDAAFATISSLNE